MNIPGCGGPGLAVFLSKLKGLFQDEHVFHGVFTLFQVYKR